MNRGTNSSISEDKRIILGLLNDSEETLDEVYNLFFPMVLKLIISNNGDEDDAKDVFQESIIILYEKVNNGSFELQSRLKTFIYAVARRLWLKRLKQQSLQVGSITDYEDAIAVEEELEVHEQRDIHFHKMEKALQHLGEPCKTIIEDFYIHNRSMQEIVEKFGYTNTDNAKTQKYKCLQRLKKLFFAD